MTRQFPRWISLILCLAAALAAGATTPGNDDDDDICDIAVLPAATLLLPYFEVDVDDPAGETTLVTITNTTNRDAVARVTLWTDRGYPALTFNVFLTGYDVYPLNLYDVLGRGVIPPALAARGLYSDASPELAACAGTAAPPGAGMMAAAALTTGSIAGGCRDVGGVHGNAIGYATIDVVGNCSANTPLDREYWTADLRSDNILTGDFQQIAVGAGTASGAPLVHIRAFPGHDFPRTFYARFQGRDARQPLPSQFAARWTRGTSLRIWRETRAGMGAACEDFAADGNLAIADMVTFDEQENATAHDGMHVELAAATKTAIGGEPFPQNGAESGWIYLNLDRTRRDAFASQAWVVDAIPLGNGCTPPAETDERIAPKSEPDGCAIAPLPAATLLLPYFEVDLENPEAEGRAFTITNVSAEDRIARVTLWTDYDFPVLTFNVYLTGYDVQVIDLYEILGEGEIVPPAGTGTQVTDRGPLSRRNPALDLGACGQSNPHLPPDLAARIRMPFVDGTIVDYASEPGCSNVGNEHEKATGYATVDVVRNCAARGPLSAEYWSEDLAWDNVLIGDGNVVHVRAVPGADFPRTFYARYQSAGAPGRDARQPLPSVFAARWAGGGEAGFETQFRIWREGRTGRDVGCGTYSRNDLPIKELVRFDEDENAFGRASNDSIPNPIAGHDLYPSTSAVSLTGDPRLPGIPNGATSGWMYLNLDHDFVVFGYAPEWPSQNWVAVSMRSGPYAVEMDATAMGDGCSPTEVPRSEATDGTEIIGPRP